MLAAMIVVSDTSPIHYLLLIDRIHLLPDLFGRVVIPPAVARELAHPSAPAEVKQVVRQARRPRARR
jgi:predicted nucleic acid-binding protein